MVLRVVGVPGGVAKAALGRGRPGLGHSKPGEPRAAAAVEAPAAEVAAEGTKLRTGAPIRGLHEEPGKGAGAGERGPDTGLYRIAVARPVREVPKVRLRSRFGPWTTTRRRR